MRCATVLLHAIIPVGHDIHARVALRGPAADFRPKVFGSRWRESYALLRSAQVFLPDNLLVAVVGYHAAGLRLLQDH